MPQVSICIPTYKNDLTIAETLQSVHNQTFKDFEIIRREDELGLGLASNLNQTVLQANGDILVFLAGDDYLLPDALQNIVNEFNKNEDIGLVTRPYYWFNGDWRVSVRKTVMKDFKIEDLIFLCGQLSGVGVRRKHLTEPFKEKRFVEFASGVIPIIKNQDAVILHTPTVAVRINSSDSCSKRCYSQSPTENWVTLFKDNFSDNPELLKKLKCYLAYNFIGLVQIRMHGGYDKAMKELGKMINLEPMIIYSYKLWFYFCLIHLPSWLLKNLRNLFIYKVNRRLCK